jgi:hypothetical protein
MKGGKVMASKVKSYIEEQSEDHGVGAAANMFQVLGPTRYFLDAAPEKEFLDEVIRRIVNDELSFPSRVIIAGAIKKYRQGVENGR